MADVEKLNINSTDYDIADAKALRNKSTAASTSFVDTKAGNTSYPTTGENQTNMFVAGYQAQIRTSGSISGVTVVGAEANATSEGSTVVGYNASSTGLHGTTIGVLSSATSYSVSVGYDADTTASYSVAVGEIAKGQGQHSTAMGYNATANTGGVSIGGYSVANGQYDIAIGRSASVNSSSVNYAIAVGYSSYAQANYSIVIGASAGVNGSATDSIAIGNSARVNSACMRSIAIGKQATAAQSESVQLGQGTNTNYGSLQFRSWQVIDQNGKIPLERLPDGVQFAVDNMPTVPYDFYSSGDDSKQLAVLYNGETIKDENDDDVLTRGLCYRTKTDYSRPSFWCTWVSDDYVPNANKDLIYIDQQKLFLKLAEISRENIDDDNFDGSYVGGDNASQDIYFYYDGPNQTWSIEFGSDSIESGTSSSPDTIEGITDLREYGVYVSDKITLPEEDYEEIFDFEYYAPIFCDSLDYNDNLFKIDYMKFMSEMVDGDWGFNYVDHDFSSWSYSDGTNTWAMPILPKEYHDEDGIIIRFEWADDESEWYQYINGDEIQQTWTTAELASLFGIYIEEDEETNVEYIEFTWKPAKQIAWEQFNPVNMDDFATAQDITDLQTALNGKLNQTKANKGPTVDFSTWASSKTDTGVYYTQANNNTYAEMPSVTQAALMVYNYGTFGNDEYITQVLVGGGVGVTIYTQPQESSMWIRQGKKASGSNTWTFSPWSAAITTANAASIDRYDSTKVQVLQHSQNGTEIYWGTAASGGDIDCGTMS